MLTHILRFDAKHISNGTTLTHIILGLQWITAKILHTRPTHWYSFDFRMAFFDLVKFLTTARRAASLRQLSLLF